MAHYVHVLRNSTGDFTNGGVTSKANHFQLIGESDPVPKTGNRPVLRVHRKGSYVYAVPVGDTPKGVGPMAGGNFVYSSDSRFTKAFGGPIAVHDRWESPQEYSLLSR